MEVSFQSSRTENQHTAARHMANATLTAAGVGATGVGLARGVCVANQVLGDEIALSNGSKVVARKGGKIFKLFQKAGQKLFGENTKLGKYIARFVSGVNSNTGGRLANPVQIKAILKNAKTLSAMGLAAGVTAFAFISRGLYQAGKINGDKA